MSDTAQPHRDPDRWESLMAEVGPERILALIRSWLGPRLRGRVDAEDLWQETLLHAWRDGASHAWRDLAHFRRWVVGIARHRVNDAADRIGAQKRGGGATDERVSQVDLAVSATPSRVAFRRERADAIAAALDALPDDQRDVVREHLLAERPMVEVAAALGITLPQAWYRFRRGASAYADALRGWASA